MIESAYIIIVVINITKSIQHFSFSIVILVRGYSGFRIHIFAANAGPIREVHPNLGAIIFSPSSHLCD